MIRLRTTKTYLRLMAFHPHRVIHIREELQVSKQLRSALTDQVGENVSSSEIPQDQGAV